MLFNPDLFFKAPAVDIVVELTSNLLISLTHIFENKLPHELEVDTGSVCYAACTHPPLVMLRHLLSAQHMF